MMENLTICTWNILSNTFISPSDYNYTNQQLTKKIHSFLPIHKRRKIIQNYLFNYQPDIILLQEVNYQDYEYYSTRLNSMYDYYYIPHNKKYWLNQNYKYKRTHKKIDLLHGNCTFLKRHTFRNTICQCFPFQLSSNGNYCPLIQIKVSKSSFLYVANIHLDDESNLLRIKQFQKLNQLLFSLLNQKKQFILNYWIIIGGDTNDIHSQLNTFYDIYHYKLIKTIRNTYQDILIKKNQPNNFYYKCDNIDKFLLTNNITYSHIPNNTITTTKSDTCSQTNYLQEYGSDHKPIIIVINLLH